MTGRTLSIIVPCYNEERTAGLLLQKVLDAPTPGWKKEVIIIDDASTDGTREILRGFESRATVIYLAQNAGKGSAVRRGLMHATGEYILLQDADLEYEPRDIASLLAVIDKGEAQVVYGSRNLRPRERRGAWIPRAGVWFLTKLINVLWGLSLTDVWTCYKLFPREAGADFAPGRFESELLFTAALTRRGYRFAEAPISYHPRDAEDGKKIRYRDGLSAIIVLVLDKIRHG